MEISNCCGAYRWLINTDICSECLEHAEWEEEDDQLLRSIDIWFYNGLSYSLFNVNGKRKQ